MKLPTNKFTRARLHLLSRPVIVLPLIILVAFIVVTLIAYSAANSTFGVAQERAISRRVQENSLKLMSSLQAYQLIALGGASFASNTSLSQESWHTYMSTFNITSYFPAINAVSFAGVMNHDDAQAFIDERNAQNVNSPMTLSATKPADEPYVILEYTEPQTPSLMSRIGIDEYTFPVRKRAIEQAILLGQPTLNNTPDSIRSSASPNSSEPGFILFAPVYSSPVVPATAAERQAAFIGTVNVSFQAAKFFDTIYGSYDKQNATYLTVYQGAQTPADKVYEGGIHPAKDDEVDYTQQVKYDDQTFIFSYQFSNKELLTVAERNRPIGVLIGGFLLGILLSVVLLFSMRARLLHLANEKEREVQSAKDELLSLASHQLRTPATGVKQYMGMVLQGFAGEITEQQRDFLQKAYDSNDRQLHIINDILHLAKLDSGRIVLSKTTFDLAETVASVLDEQAQSVKEAKIKIEKHMPKHVKVYADAHMLRMVVENLISNAVKYTHPGGRVNVTLHAIKNNIELCVQDTGVGIDASDMDKLFKQFSRVANERSHLVSGTGVGLYLVKNLVELHGGEVSVSSKVGKGTKFTVMLPAQM